MMKLDRNSSQSAIDTYLSQSQNLIDNRSVEDWYEFLGGFSELINFYDKKNQLNGNWSPFLLKDPVFLSASIAKTDFETIYGKFVNACNSLQKTLKYDSQNNNLLSEAFAELFKQIIDCYVIIESWSEYMIQSTVDYDLKSYTLHQIENFFSPVFWAVLDLRNLMFKTLLEGDFNSNDVSKFDNFNVIVWKTNKNKEPFWTVLGIPLVALDLELILSNSIILAESLIYNGQKTFSFFKGIIDLATSKLDSLMAKPSEFPDTLLLRTFVELLQASQSDLNGLTGKHLKFYYDKVLKQDALLAEPDSVFIAATLAKPNAAFELQSEIAFLAGLDEKKNPIIFNSVKQTKLNPAKITEAYIIGVDSLPKSKFKLFLNHIPKPSQVLKNQNGTTKGWDTFGNSSKTDLIQFNTGIAFASPLLKLTEGKRVIAIKLTFSDLIDTEELSSATFYLSTKKGWFKLTDFETFFSDPLLGILQQELLIIIELKQADPPIEVYEKCPDGYQPEWPVFKMTFDEYVNFKTPPVIENIKIDVCVLGLKTFQLSNENGSLNTSKPFQLFGPIPQENSSFYIGNEELLSKPTLFYNLDLEWDALTSDFATYYQEYNEYINHDFPPSTKQSICRKIWNSLAFWKQPSSQKKEEVNLKPPVFFNNAFEVEFKVLDDYTWKDSNIKQSDTSTILNLFVTDSSTGNIKASTVFSNSQKVNDSSLDPSIQSSHLKLSNQTPSGFLKMSLINPPEAFGHAMYPQLISAIALLNANLIVKTKGADPSAMIPAPNTPYIPTLKGFNANYVAGHKYELNYVENDYPIQCYHYSAFKNYLIYDNTQSFKEYKNQIGQPLFGQPLFSKKKLTAGIELFPGLDFDGVLLLRMDDLVSPEQLSVYFEIAESPFRVQGEGFTLDYFVLLPDGWQSLTLISDSTKGLTCSGILVFDIPSITSEKYVNMPDGGFWCGIGLNGKPKAVPQTTFVQTNGVKLQRGGNSFLNDDNLPSINANVIVSPQFSIPEISKVVQPFSSFGGRDAETESVKNLRIANRLKTKEKLVTANDYRVLIYQQFDAVFYTKVYFDLSNHQVNIRLVKKVESEKEANAFLPLFSECFEENVLDYLNGRASFEQLTVQNFNLEYLTINATVYIKPDFDLQSTADKITQALKIFLSPWIKSNAKQILIDQGISDSEVADFITGFNEVDAIDGILFKVSSIDQGNEKVLASDVKSYLPEDRSALLVSIEKQKNIIWKMAV